MDIQDIKTEADYRCALSSIEKLMHAAPQTPDGDRLDILVNLVQAYEAIHVPLRSTGDVLPSNRGHVAGDD